MLDGDAVRDRESRLALDPDDAHPGPSLLQRERDPGGEPSPADGNQEGLGLRSLLGKLEADRALPCDDAFVLERVHERCASRLDVGGRGGDGLVEPLADEHRLAAVGAGSLDLRHRRVLRHEDRRRNPRLARRPGDGLTVVPGARGGDAGAPFRRPERRDRVERAADLEGPRPLEVLGFQVDVAAGEP